MNADIDQAAPASGNVELSVVIPCYRTSSALEELLARLTTSLQGVGKPYEIILVDDCSPDDLSEKVRDAQARYPHVRYVELMFNVGQFRALICGLAHARGRFVVTMDDDLQHPPEEIQKLYAHLSAHPELDAVFGAYVTKQHTSGRNLGSLFIRTVNTYVFGKPRDLVMSSFRCLRRELVDTLLAHRTRYPVIGPLILSSTRRIANVAVQHDPRKHGVSNYRLGRLIRTTLDNVLNFSALPLQVISLVGVGVAAVSFITGAAFFIIRVVRGTGATGWTSLFLAINFYGGLSLLAVGIIGEYLIRILGESKGQPLYIVRRRLGEDNEPLSRSGEADTIGGKRR
jgi:glycosyltransferase involved in cell wall biosynthesis